jgi:hypothetical protein
MYVYNDLCVYKVQHPSDFYNKYIPMLFHGYIKSLDSTCIIITQNMKDKNILFCFISSSIDASWCRL